MNLVSIPALSDNYIWLLHNHDSQCLVIDPGEADPVLQALDNRHLTPVAILLTHHHPDHVAGVVEILRHFTLPIYGPKETYDKGATHIVDEGDVVILLDHTFRVMRLPGHTLGHIGFYSAPWFFCGDTVFSAGCGRLLEGHPKQMYESLQKINQLPPDTFICAAHEYTLSNLDFAASILPQDGVIRGYKQHIKKLRLKKQPSLPTTLYVERRINLFLRCHDLRLQKALNIYPIFGAEWSVFSLLRNKKDHF
ncbi:hydroxyacylglutathione hydrolase [secondary endosymbiont of Ctenarytaina eucalypti]|uniref:Hydroxyacylglutathione hydrolase n=1 Tax=secondary endosymbiont of Ctenarytaina eucalypti TaxID=1199245 RepID=J3Z2Y5_9ENTR|nr:hydroxyacylglutathione hydrolase [secondary endosymbiont of Ctenarytaina eucalypti]AFP84574.1 hydroxyacylglutathione hydrolase [secondary endosymbiont of Ctenarytaina eucalypti]